MHCKQFYLGMEGKEGNRKKRKKDTMKDLTKTLLRMLK